MLYLGENIQIVMQNHKKYNFIIEMSVIFLLLFKVFIFKFLIPNILQLESPWHFAPKFESTNESMFTSVEKLI